MVEYKHTLNQGLVKALIKLYEQPEHSGSVSKLGLTHNQQANFQKLRYWGIVEMLDKAGHWRVTDPGIAFIENGWKIPKSVMTYRGEPSTTQEEFEQVSLNSFFPAGYEKRPDYLRTARNQNIDAEQLTLTPRACA